MLEPKNIDMNIYDELDTSFKGFSRTIIDPAAVDLLMLRLYYQN